MTKWIITSIIALVLIGFSTDAEAQRKNRNKDKAEMASTSSGAFELSKGMLKMYKFRSIGPAAYSGRISDLAVNPDNTSEYLSLIHI